MQATFVSSTTGSTFSLIADNSTVSTVLPLVRHNCSTPTFHLDNTTSSSAPFPYGDGADSTRAEEAVQYFRASSVALTLDGYNNTAALAGNETAPAPLPSGVDTTLLACLNATSGEAVPLFSDAASGLPIPSMGLVGLVYVIWSLTSYI